MLETAQSSATDIRSDEFLQFYMNVLVLGGEEVTAAAAA
jgi:hypothetical protein